jgi:hypothetical protein
MSRMAPFYKDKLIKEVIIVTVGTQIQQTIASAESVMANLKTFALETQDQQAKQVYQQLSQQTENMVSVLKSRMNYIQQEEPQYKQS